MKKHKPVEHLFEIGARVIPKEFRPNEAYVGVVVDQCRCGKHVLVDIEIDDGAHYVTSWAEANLRRVTDA